MVQAEQLSRHQNAARPSSPQEGKGRTEVRAAAAALDDVADACIINGENEKIDLETTEQIWDMPVVRLWADILGLFEGKGCSGFSSFWSMMCAAVKRVNPKIKGHPGDFAVARNDLQQAWHGLLKMYQDENKPLEALIDRLQVEQHLEMMRLMAAHPQ